VGDACGSIGQTRPTGPKTPVYESDYYRSWRQAFEVLNANPRSTSCLMTSMTDPSSSNFLVCWPMYGEDENVYIQNAIIFLDEIEGAFDPAAPWGYVGPRHNSHWLICLKLRFRHKTANAAFIGARRRRVGHVAPNGMRCNATRAT
jgi:hypothetical protein